MAFQRVGTLKDPSLEARARSLEDSERALRDGRPSLLRDGNGQPLYCGSPDIPKGQTVETAEEMFNFYRKRFVEKVWDSLPECVRDFFYAPDFSYNPRQKSGLYVELVETKS